MEDIPIPILRTASQALKLPAGKRCKYVLMVTRANPSPTRFSRLLLLFLPIHVIVYGASSSITLLVMVDAPVAKSADAPNSKLGSLWECGFESRQGYHNHHTLGK